MIMAIIQNAATEWNRCAICMSERNRPKPGMSRSSTRPDATMITPGIVTPHQKIPFSPALKRCEGTSCSPSMPPALDNHTKSATLAMLSLIKVMMIKARDTANKGPTKLCTFLSKKVSQPNSVGPRMGSRKNLPRDMTMPDNANAQNANALDQCTARSKGVKRSIFAGSAEWSLPIGPLPKYRMATANRAMPRKAAP